MKNLFTQSIQWLPEVKNLDRAKNVDEIFLPGEIERRNNQQNQTHGIQLPIAVRNELKVFADRLNVDFDIEKTEAIHPGAFVKGKQNGICNRH